MKKFTRFKPSLKDEGRLKKVFFSCKSFYSINRINHFSEIRNVVFHSRAAAEIFSENNLKL